VSRSAPENRQGGRGEEGGPFLRKVKRFYSWGSIKNESKNGKGKPALSVWPPQRAAERWRERRGDDLP